jgi:poly-beta-1,6-N-acetyl-D-glucosamine synthase
MQTLTLLPAHNEAGTICEAVKAAAEQVDRVVVVADNCTDGTEALAAEAGAEVFVTKDNVDKKAGGLNQALRTFLPSLTDGDVLLVADADSVLDEGFVEAAVHHLGRDSDLGAVGGTFRGDYSHGGLLGHLQRNEYARYARDVRRLKGRCLVVTGTAAAFRVKALREVSEARIRGSIPQGDGNGGVYDTTVLTEDNEITFALMHLGWTVLSPRDCTLTTEVMASWQELWNQRLRWKRGAVENCVQYGWTPVTRSYWGRQVMTMLGVVVTAIYFASIVWALLGPGLYVAPFWLGVTGIFVAERVITLRDRGWRRMMLAATMYELLYDAFMQTVHAKAYLDAATGRKRNW